MIEIIPAIDIIDGRCVRLTRGDYSTVKSYDAPVTDMVRSYADCGVRRLHMVDLDGAKQSCITNLRCLEAAADILCRDFGGSTVIEWGGGISSSEALSSVFDAGASFAIAGSIAVLQAELFEQWLERYGKQMILGADVNNGKVAIKGWREESQYSVDELVSRFSKSGLTQVICTDISRDGLLQGPAEDLYVRLQTSFQQIDITVSGGISSMDDIAALDKLNLRKVIVGKAIYEGRITLKQIEKWSQNV